MHHGIKFRFKLYNYAKKLRRLPFAHFQNSSGVSILHLVGENPDYKN